jgi:phosphatidylserine decarboxylase
VFGAGHRGPKHFACDEVVKKGQELGWFEHGSTIIVLTPDRFSFAENVKEGQVIRMGQPLLRRPD